MHAAEVIPTVTMATCVCVQQASVDQVAARVRGPITQSLAAAMETSLQDQRRLLVDLAANSLGNSSRMQSLRSVEALAKRKLAALCYRAFTTWDETTRSNKSRRRVEAFAFVNHSRRLLRVGFAELSWQAARQRALQKTARNIVARETHLLLAGTFSSMHSRSIQARNLALKTCRRTIRLQSAAWARWAEKCAIRRQYALNSHKIVLRGGRTTLMNALQRWVRCQDELSLVCRKQACASKLAEQRCRGYLCQVLGEWLGCVQQQKALALESLENLRMQHRAEAKAMCVRKRLLLVALRSWRNSATHKAFTRLLLARFRIRSCRRRLLVTLSFWRAWQSQHKHTEKVIARFHVDAERKLVGRVWIQWAEYSDVAQAAQKRAVNREAKLAHLLRRTQAMSQRDVIRSFDVILSQGRVASKLRNRIKAKKLLCTYGWCFGTWHLQFQYKKELTFKCRQIADRRVLNIVRLVWDWTATILQGRRRRSALVARGRLRSRRALISRAFAGFAAYLIAKSLMSRRLSRARHQFTCRLRSQSMQFWIALVAAQRRVMRFEQRRCMEASKLCFRAWSSITADWRQRYASARSLELRVIRFRSGASLHYWQQYARIRVRERIRSRRLVHIASVKSLGWCMYSWADVRLKGSFEKQLIRRRARRMLSSSLRKWMTAASDRKALARQERRVEHMCKMLECRRKIRIWSALMAAIQEVHHRGAREARREAAAARLRLRHLAQTTLIDWQRSTYAKQRFRVGMQRVVRRQVLHMLRSYPCMMQHNDDIDKHNAK